VDLGLALAGLFVGVVVGLTGMGGGALMTPVLVFFFGVQPLAAVSSDLVASAVMKPLGGYVHLRRRTVNLDLVKWLAVGSVPAAFAGVLVLRWLGDDESVQQVVKVSLGIALFVAAASLIGKAYIQLAERGRRRASGTARSSEQSGRPDVIVRPMATVLVGALGGLIVGMTSVGSGSLIIIALLALYPSLQASQLVGTDLVQAVPLVASAAVAHLFFGDFHLDVTASLLIGCLPGVYVGAQLSSRAPAGIVRRALSLVLLASALKLVGASTPVAVAVLAAVMLAGPPLWAWARVRHGFPPLASHKTRLVRLKLSQNDGDRRTSLGGRRP
jgi:uncharacterized protein